MGVPVAVATPGAVWGWLTVLAKCAEYSRPATIMTRARPVPASRI